MNWKKVAKALGAKGDEIAEERNRWIDAKRDTSHLDTTVLILYSLSEAITKGLDE